MAASAGHQEGELSHTTHSSSGYASWPCLARCTQRSEWPVFRCSAMSLHVCDQCTRACRYTGFRPWRWAISWLEPPHSVEADEHNHSDGGGSSKQAGGGPRQPSSGATRGYCKSQASRTRKVVLILAASTRSVRSHPPKPSPRRWAVQAVRLQKSEHPALRSFAPFRRFVTR